MPKFTQSDLDYLTATIWAEARGEGPLGMTLVAQVVHNRMKHPNKRLFGGPFIKGVVTKPKQFSCWNLDDPNSVMCRALVAGEAVDLQPGDLAALKDARLIATTVLNGSSPDMTRGAVYYHTTRVNPRWNRTLDVVAQVGNHVFYADA